MTSETIVPQRTEKKSGNRKLNYLDRLAREQNIRMLKTPEDVENLFALWPGKEEPDEFDNFVRKDRSERRKVEKNNP